MEEQQVKFEGHAIIELMGRQVIAGFVSEQVIAGAAMLRVDVPATATTPAYTKYYGGTAIYAITPTDAAMVQRAVDRLRPRPVEPWIIASAAVIDRRLVDSYGADPEWGGDGPDQDSSYGE